MIGFGPRSEAYKMPKLSNQSPLIHSQRTLDDPVVAQK